MYDKNSIAEPSAVLTVQQTSNVIRCNR